MPVGTRSVAKKKTEVPISNAFSQCKVGKIFTACRSVKLKFITLIKFVRMCYEICAYRIKKHFCSVPT